METVAGWIYLARVWHRASYRYPPRWQLDRATIEVLAPSPARLQGVEGRAPRSDPRWAIGKVLDCGLLARWDFGILDFGPPVGIEPDRRDLLLYFSEPTPADYFDRSAERRIRLSSR